MFSDVVTEFYVLQSMAVYLQIDFIVNIHLYL